MRIHLYFCLILIIASLQSFADASMSEALKKSNLNQDQPCYNNLLGSIEDAVFIDKNISVKSRVDTGAKHSSMHAENLKVFEENGVNYAQYYMVDDLGYRFEVVDKIEGTSDVTNTSGISETRYVVQKNILLKGKKFTINVNLNDRSNMMYKFLIGRDIIKSGGFVVDVQ